MAKEDLPGLVLRVHEEQLTPCAGQSYLATGYITLTAEVNDLGVWDKVVEKLEGMAVYSVSTLADTLVQAAQRRANQAESMAMQTMEEARARIDQLEASLSFRTAENENLKHQLANAQQELVLLRDFERTINEAERRR